MKIQLQLNFDQEHMEVLQSVLSHADQEKIMTLLVQLYLDFIGNDFNNETEKDEHHT
jgi:hypothetical protein